MKIVTGDSLHLTILSRLESETKSQESQRLIFEFIEAHIRREMSHCVTVTGHIKNDWIVSPNGRHFDHF